MRSIIFATLFLLAGCSFGGKYVNSLTPDVRNSLFIKSVDVVWDEKAIAKNVARSTVEQQKLEDLTIAIKKNVELAFENSPSGSEAASIKITLIAGSTSNASGSAIILRDSDGAALANYDINAVSDRSGFMKMAQGKDSKINEVSTNLSSLLYREFFR